MPDHALVRVGRRDAPRGPGEVLPYRPRVLALTGLLVIGLLGLAWQHWPGPPARVVPVSLEAGVIVT